MKATLPPQHIHIDNRLFLNYYFAVIFMSSPEAIFSSSVRKESNYSILGKSSLPMHLFKFFHQNFTQLSYRFFHFFLTVCKFLFLDNHKLPRCDRLNHIHSLKSHKFNTEILRRPRKSKDAFKKQNEVLSDRKCLLEAKKILLNF